MQEVQPNQKSDLAADLPAVSHCSVAAAMTGRKRARPHRLASTPRRFDFLEARHVLALAHTDQCPRGAGMRLYNRIATWARLRIHGTSQSDTGRQHALGSHRIDRTQGSRPQQITQWLELNSRHCEQVMLFGDFNSEIDSAQLRLITESSLGLRDARAASKSAPFGPARYLQQFLDDLSRNEGNRSFLPWARQIEVERYLVLAQLIDGRWPSDHFPAFVDLKLTECQLR